MLEESILTSTKKILGIPEDYDVYDLDVLTHINSALFTLRQLGIGPALGLIVEDDTATWNDFTLDDDGLIAVRSYIFLKVRVAFDPPKVGFLLDAMTKQIQEHEWRLSVYREELTP